MRYLFALSLAVFAANADPVAVTWSGTPAEITGDCPGCPYGFSPTAYDYTVGPNAYQDVSINSSAWGYGPSTNAMISDSFNLASAAEVSLTVNAYYSASGTSCSDGGCAPQTSWSMSGQFSGYEEIVGPDGTVDLSLPFGGSATVPGTCDPANYGACFATVSLSNNESGTAQLAAGDYTLEIVYSDQNSSRGDSYTGATVDAVLTDPIATPEPRLVWLMVLLIPALRLRSVLHRGL